MAIEKQDHESQIKLTKKRSNSYTDPIIIDKDKEEIITLEPKKKRHRLGSWWNYAEAINELSCVVKGSSKTNDNNSDDVPRLDSCFSSTDLHEKKEDDKSSSLSLSDHDNFIDLSEDDNEIVGNQNNKDDVPRVDSCVSSTDLHEKKKDDKSSSLSPNHHDNFIDLSEDGDEIVAEGTCISSNSNKGNGHVRLEELGVTVEDLKSMPWELFDPIWEIRSETMDPWLGGYVKDIASSGP